MSIDEQFERYQKVSNGVRKAVKEGLKLAEGQDTQTAISILHNVIMDEIGVALTEALTSNSSSSSR